MKNIITILLITIAFSCKAQSPIINIADNNAPNSTDDRYYKDVQNKFTPFIGTWKWINTNDTITITINKVEMAYESFGKYYSDYLIGKYKYVKNGVEIINTLNYNITKDNVWSEHPNYPKNGYTPMLGGYQTDKISKFHFRDFLKDKSEKASFELLPDTFVNGVIVKTARLRLSNSEHWNVNGQNPRDPEFTIPTDIILTKQ